MTDAIRNVPFAPATTTQAINSELVSPDYNTDFFIGVVCWLSVTAIPTGGRVNLILQEYDFATRTWRDAFTLASVTAVGTVRRTLAPQGADVVGWLGAQVRFVLRFSGAAGSYGYSLYVRFIPSG